MALETIVGTGENNIDKSLVVLMAKASKLFNISIWISLVNLVLFSLLSIMACAKLLIISCILPVCISICLISGAATLTLTIGAGFGCCLFCWSIIFANRCSTGAIPSRIFCCCAIDACSSGVLGCPKNILDAKEPTPLIAFDNWFEYDAGSFIAFKLLFCACCLSTGRE